MYSEKFDKSLYNIVSEYCSRKCDVTEYDSKCVEKLKYKTIDFHFLSSKPCLYIQIGNKVNFNYLLFRTGIS